MGKNVFSDPDNSQERFLKEIPENLGWFLVGFTEGEGSFNVSVTKREDYVHRWKVVLSFNISQKEGRILDLVKDLLKCGTIRSRKDEVYAFEVRAIDDIREKVIPFFNRFGLFSPEKRKAFGIFREIERAMTKGEHLKIKGIKKILKLRKGMNPTKRKKKYTDQEILLSFKKILRGHTPSPTLFARASQRRG